MVTRALYASSPDWAAAGRGLDQLVDGANFRVVKKNSRTLAGIAHINGEEVFLKRVTNQSWLKGVIARFCGSRARKTIRGARVLARAGFAHPKLLAAFEQHRRGSVTASYVIVEYLRRPIILSRFALADGQDFHWRRTISASLAQTIRSLHGAGCYTRDLQETNVMLAIESGRPKIYFTDLEDFRRLPLVPWRLRLHNLIQLDRSIGRFISRAHRLRFLHNYLGDNAGRAEARVLVRRLNRLHRRIERRRLHRERSTAILMPVADPRTSKIDPAPTGAAGSPAGSLARREP
jgi:hypothetical protein